VDPIVIATGNPHKVDELRAIFAEQGIPVVGLKGLPGSPDLREPEETGRTFEENAAIKARSYAAQTGRLCLADDSGLEVDALGGAPGVISSHYCTDGREAGMSREERDRRNNERVLRELEGAADDARSARFVCVMVLAAPDGRVLAASRGTFEGRIGRPGDVPRGTHGFGYDPLFLVAPAYTSTSAELPPAEKNRLSHRSAAARLMATRLPLGARGTGACGQPPQPPAPSAFSPRLQLPP
jgi:XTP/dITP diphosphohydrolase